MSQPPPLDPAVETSPGTPPDISPDQRPAEPSNPGQPSFVKLAMRNMVRKGGKSLFHFSLTVTALLTLLVGLAYLTR